MGSSTGYGSEIATAVTVPALLRQKVDARVASQAQQIFLNSNVGIQRSGALCASRPRCSAARATRSRSNADPTTWSIPAPAATSRIGDRICKHVWATVLEAESELGFDFAPWTKTKSGPVSWVAAAIAARSSAEDPARSSDKISLPVAPSSRPRLTAKPPGRGSWRACARSTRCSSRMATPGWGRGEVLYTVEALEDEPGLCLRTWSREAGRARAKEGEVGRIRVLRMLVPTSPSFPRPAIADCSVRSVACPRWAAAFATAIELPASFDLVVAALPAFLELLGETGRAFWSEREGSPPDPRAHPFAWLPEPVECRLRLTRTDHRRAGSVGDRPELESQGCAPRACKRHPSPWSSRSSSDPAG